MIICKSYLLYVNTFRYLFLKIKILKITDVCVAYIFEIFFQCKKNSVTLYNMMLPSMIFMKYVQISIAR